MLGKKQLGNQISTFCEKELTKSLQFKDPEDVEYSTSALIYLVYLNDNKVCVMFLSYCIGKQLFQHCFERL